jgi:hypothetical protein
MDSLNGQRRVKRFQANLNVAAPLHIIEEDEATEVIGPQRADAMGCIGHLEGFLNGDTDNPRPGNPSARLPQGNGLVVSALARHEETEATAERGHG